MSKVLDFDYEEVLSEISYLKDERNRLLTSVQAILDVPCTCEYFLSCGCHQIMTKIAKKALEGK